MYLKHDFAQDTYTSVPVAGNGTLDLDGQFKVRMLG